MIHEHLEFVCGCNDWFRLASMIKIPAFDIQVFQAVRTDQSRLPECLRVPRACPVHGEELTIDSTWNLRAVLLQKMAELTFALDKSDDEGEDPLRALCQRLDLNHELVCRIVFECYREVDLFERDIYDKRIEWRKAMTIKRFYQTKYH